MENGKDIKRHVMSAGTVDVVTIHGAAGRRAVLSGLGAAIVALEVPDRQGRLTDVVLGYDCPESYMADGPCMGKVPGRYAGRIARGEFILDGKAYALARNNGPNALHGGPTGFANRIWTLIELTDSKACFAYDSADGEEGYPGNLHVTAAYEWIEGDTLTLTLEGHTDSATVVNLTNHAYFNLAGHGAGGAIGQELRLNASRWLPTDDTMIPTGELDSVIGTPMDFTSFKPITRDIECEFPALKIGKGYDNTWVIDGEPGRLREAASLRSPLSGIRLDIATTQPGIQLYTGNWLEGCPQGKDGVAYHDYDGIALECQAFPDAPNQRAFPAVTLRPGQTYKEIIKFRFSVY